MTLGAFEDPNHKGNSKKYHIGAPCIKPNCEQPAGTAWSPLLCFECNVKRIRKINQQFINILLINRELEEEAEDTP